jgi:hypothetical protein
MVVDRARGFVLVVALAVAGCSGASVSSAPSSSPLLSTSPELSTSTAPSPTDVPVATPTDSGASDPTSPPRASSRPAARPSDAPPTGAPPTDAPPDDGVAGGLGIGHWIECHDEDTLCDVHLSGNVRDPAGWPVVLDGPCRELVTAPTGLAYVGCSVGAAGVLHVIDGTGNEPVGWPVQLDGPIASVAWNDFSIGCGVGRSAVRVDVEGTVFAAVATDSAAKLYVFEANGTARPGWPQRIPGDAPANDGFGGNGCRGFDLADDGSVVGWGYEDVPADIELVASRTELIAWEADGRVRSGWPIGSVGAASGPVLGNNGDVTYVSASGRMWSHDEHGEVRSGWPYQLDSPSAPYGSADGRIATVTKVSSAPDRLVLLDRDGEPVTGAPIRLPADIETRCLFGDTPCAGESFLEFAPDGTLYVSLAWSTTEHVVPDTTDVGGALAAYDPAGRIIRGWPVDLAARTHVLNLNASAGDRLVARGYICPEGQCGGDGTVATVLVFSPDGKLLDQTTEP